MQQVRWSKDVLSPRPPHDARCEGTNLDVKPCYTRGDKGEKFSLCVCMFIHIQGLQIRQIWRFLRQKFISDSTKFQ